MSVEELNILMINNATMIGLLKMLYRPDENWEGVQQSIVDILVEDITMLQKHTGTEALLLRRLGKPNDLKVHGKELVRLRHNLIKELKIDV